MFLVKVNSYPCQRIFTAIGYGGEDFVDSMVTAVENHLGPVHMECISQRESSNGKYLSVRVGPVWVQTADQVSNFDFDFIMFLKLYFDFDRNLGC